MKSRLGRDHDDPSYAVDLTPMLDVVFILLIFFVVTATFVRETGLDAARPSDEVLRTVDRQASILITIDSMDSIVLEDRIIDRRMVRANVQRLHAENPEQGVVILPLPGSTTATLVAVMDGARQASVFDISLAKAE